MDAYTLVVACMLLGVVMAASMGMLYLAGARQRCLLDWSVAGAAFAVNNIGAMIAVRLQIDHFLVPGIGNACYVVGHFGILAGLRRHAGADPHWKWMAALGLAIVGVHALPFVHGSVVHRMILLTPLVAGCDVGAARLLWRHADRHMRTVGLPLVVLELLFALQMTLRALYLVASEHTSLTFMGSEFLQTSGSLFVLMFLSIGTMCCVLIVMHDQAQALRLAALTDALTGWLNRRALNDMAAQAFARCRRSGAPLHVIIFDIDHFKSINDRHGHAVGDAAIRHVTATAAQVLQEGDARFRIGGEEFAVLLCDTTAQAAQAIAERLRAQVAAHRLELQDGALAMTVSVGLATLRAQDAGWDDVLQRADAALYQAKRHGRNRVAAADHFIQTA